MPTRPRPLRHRQLGWAARTLGGSLVVATAASYKGQRYPVEIISHCVWLYYRFALSLRDISEMMLERGVVVSHETVRQWCAKFGQGYQPAP